MGLGRLGHVSHPDPVTACPDSAKSMSAESDLDLFKISRAYAGTK